MKLYYSKGACSLAVRIIIHELNLKCDYEAVDLKTKKTKTGKDYLTINPKGAVPALMLDNNQILTENGAIQQYLADINHADQLLPPLNDLNRYRVLEWLNYASSDIHKGFGPLFNHELSDEIKEKIFKPALEKKFNGLDQHLKDNQFLTGDQFTLPDAYLFAMLRWFKVFKIDMNRWPNISRYFQELKERPSIRKSLEEEGLSS